MCPNAFSLSLNVLSSLAGFISFQRLPPPNCPDAAILAAMDTSVCECPDFCRLSGSGWVCTWPRGGQVLSVHLPGVLWPRQSLPWTPCVLLFGISHETPLLNVDPVLLHKLFPTTGCVLWESTSHFLRKSILNTHWKDWCWNWSSNTLVNGWEQPTHWKRCWCWERLRAEGEEGNRRWDAGCHHRCNGRELGQTLGDGEGQRGLAYCSPLGCEESNMTG